MYNVYRVYQWHSIKSFVISVALKQIALNRLFRRLVLTKNTDYRDEYIRSLYDFRIVF